MGAFVVDQTDFGSIWNPKLERWIHFNSLMTDNCALRTSLWRGRYSLVAIFHQLIVCFLVFMIIDGPGKKEKENQPNTSLIVPPGI